MPENEIKSAASHAAQSRGVLSSERKRLASSRSVEITGFTLIELLIVIAILSVPATIGFIKYSAFIEQTKETTAIADLKEIAKLIDEHKDRTGGYPDTLLDRERGEFKNPWENPYKDVNIAGSVIPQEIQEKTIDPFFTTKGPEKGPSSKSPFLPPREKAVFLRLSC